MIKQITVNPLNEGLFSTDFSRGFNCGARRQFHADVEAIAKANASKENEWIPVSDKLPKENEYVGNVCKYYLIQDEYGDMHVAHLSGRGWETIESIKTLGCDVVAWMPLPEPYREDGEA